MMAKVYIQVDERDRVIAINSSVFLTDITEWILVDEGQGDKYTHAQGNYLSEPLQEEHGIPLWYSDGEQVLRRSDEDVQEDINALPPAPPTELEQLQAVIDALMGRNTDG